MASSSSPSYLAFFLLAVLVSLSAAHAAHHTAAAPAPAADCSTVVLSLADCLTFVMNGSTTTKPEGTCCSGLKTVLKTNADCLCQTFKNSGDLGIALNVTKALTLPSACKLQSPPMSSCQMSMAPAGAPGIAGGSNAVPPSEMIEAPAPAPVGGAPTSNSPPAAVFSVGSLVAVAILAVASFYFYY